MRHVERGADGREVLLGLLRGLPATLGSRLDAQRPQQVGRGRPRITGLAQDRMQTFGGQVMKHQVDNAPRVIGLGIRGMSAFTVDVHSAQQNQPETKTAVST